MGKETTQLYIRFPIKIKEELDVKNLCSYIEAVRLPRQKSTRWCIVDFKSAELKEEAIKILKDVVINGKRLVIKQVRSKSKLRQSQKKSDCINTVQELLEF